MFSNTPKPKSTDDYERYIKVALQEAYYYPCIKVCISDYASPLSGQEKVCLAKCLDRAYDYMRVIEKQSNPFNQTIKSKYYTKLDGNNLLGLKQSKFIF